MATAADISQALEEIALLLDLSGENPFKVRAYANAARLLRAADENLPEFIAAAKAGEIKGIGRALAEKIAAMHETGESAVLTELRARFPAGLLELFNVPGLGAKKVKVLYEQLGIASLSELEQACRENHLLQLPGFGQKTQDNILSGIARLRRHSGRFLISVAGKAAAEILAALQATKLAQHLELAGSLRRRLETVKDIDILAVSDRPTELMDAFVALPGVERVTGHGATKSSVVLSAGIAVDLRVVQQDQFVAALAHFTGSKDHNTLLRGLAKKQGMKLNEYGLFADDRPLPLADEADLHRRLGLHYIPPELREGLDEIDRAAAGESPRLIEVGDLRGVVHAHTSYSDGALTVRQLAEAVRRRGYLYLGVADHSQSAAYAGGLKPDDVKRQHEEIDRLNEELAPFRIFKGIESDILPDGRLDYDERTLTSFDFVIASVHSKFNMDQAAMTARLLTAIAAPFTTIIGHLTGRLLLGRDGYPLDVPAVLEAAAQHGAAVELNANPHRLDLDWRRHRLARELGVLVPICPDAHQAAGIDDLAYGVGIARKGGLTVRDVPTAWEVARFAEWLARRKT